MVPKKASFSVISISVFGCFSVDDRKKESKSTNECGHMKTKRNTSVMENILLRFRA